MALTVGSLFAGIGGFDLAAERAGFEVKWQVEIDPYCTQVLEKHWPHVRRYRDIRDCCGSLLRAERVDTPVGEDGRCAECGRAHWLPWVDIVCGGFPCQDISLANRFENGGGLGLDGERSGLWGDFARIAGELRPRWLVVENSPALAFRGLDVILADLARLGFDAAWTTIRASQVGARHRRERMFICAHANGDGLQGWPAGPLARVAVSTLGKPIDWPPVSAPLGCRSADGIPARVDRTHALGNAIVPQGAQWLFERIKEAEGLTAF